jgi:hypothetical protein
MRSITVLAVALAAALAVASGKTEAVSAFTSSSGSLVNGDFDTGDLTGWTSFTTVNGLALMTVTPFDTNGDGIATFSAQFSVGQSAFEGSDVQRGGGIFQAVSLGSGELSISADIASEFTFPFCNSDAGTVSLLVDGVEVDAHNFGEICGPSIKYSSLNANVLLSTAGMHEIRFLVTRAATLSGVLNFLDDVVLSGPATENAEELLQDLLDLVDSQELGSGTSLHDKLVQALTQLRHGDVVGTCDTLNAFLNSVRAQSGKSLTVEQAAQLTSDALRIEGVIGC